MPRLVIVSNRTPGKKPAAGGLAVALKKVLARHDGFWFGWSGQFAAEPRAEAAFETVDGLTVGAIDLTKPDYRAYYEGFSNSVLWPACHHRLDLADIQPDYFDGYMRVNRRFAEALMPHLRPDDVIWVHDYHLIPLAEELRALGAANRIGFFLHIPFPGPETVMAIPHHRELMRAFSAYDLLGFQAVRDVQKFNESVINTSLAEFTPNTAENFRARLERVEAFPIGTDPEAFAELTNSQNARRTASLVTKSLAGRDLILGIDRLDYSKGLPQRILAYERLLEHYPIFRRKVHMLQIAPPSRDTIAEYQTIIDQLDHAAGHLMGRFAEPDWAPLNYVKRTYPQSALAGLYRIARVGLVTPLRDGMNLVAHEYVACQDPEDPGVLVLSRFAGAAEIMPEALLVNPFDIDEMADALKAALEMPLNERRARHEALIASVRHHAIDNWADAFLTALGDDAKDDVLAPEPRAGAGGLGQIAPAAARFA